MSDIEIAQIREVKGKRRDQKEEGDSSAPVDDGSPIMTSALVSSICKENGGYRSPELNEQIYLHFRGFTKIQNLEEFENCRVLWLENNSISGIENLESLPHLGCLYLQHNLLTKLNPHCQLNALQSLNISHNKVTSLEGISAMPNLQKLLAAHNELQSIEPILECPQLTVVDVSYNKLEESEATIECLGKLESLGSTMLQGNPLVRSTKFYRKAMIQRLPGLKYLDDHPVFADERRQAAAFHAGGVKAEKEERAQIKKEEEKRVADHRAFFDNFIKSSKPQAAPVSSKQADPKPDTKYFQTMQKVAVLEEDTDGEIYVPKVPVALNGKTAGGLAGKAPSSAPRIASPSKSEESPRRVDGKKKVETAAADKKKGGYVDPLADVSLGAAEEENAKGESTPGTQEKKKEGDTSSPSRGGDAAEQLSEDAVLTKFSEEVPTELREYIEKLPDASFTATASSDS